MIEYIIDLFSLFIINNINIEHGVDNVVDILTSYINIDTEIKVIHY
jgi:hypothetical protein